MSVVAPPMDAVGESGSDSSAKRRKTDGEGFARTSSPLRERDSLLASHPASGSTAEDSAYGASLEFRTKDTTCAGFPELEALDTLPSQNAMLEAGQGVLDPQILVESFSKALGQDEKMPIATQCVSCSNWKTTPFEVNSKTLQMLLSSGIADNKAALAVNDAIEINPESTDCEAFEAHVDHHLACSVDNFLIHGSPAFPQGNFDAMDNAAEERLASAAADAVLGDIPFNGGMRGRFAGAANLSFAKPANARAASMNQSRQHVVNKVDLRSVKKESIVKTLGSQRLTEKEILREVGDSRYTREVLRKLLAEGKVYRIGKGGAGDPFRYVTAEFYDGPDKLPPGVVPDVGIELRLIRVASRIKQLLRGCEESLTEREVRLQIGDNVGTGKALRCLVQQGHVIRDGRGGSGDPYKYKLCQEFAHVELQQNHFSSLSNPNGSPAERSPLIGPEAQDTNGENVAYSVGDSAALRASQFTALSSLA